MRFGVLGPLAVWTDSGEEVKIPEVKVRALLAELVVNAGRVVPSDRLIDHLWPTRLPANPAGALQTRVSQLRRAIGTPLVLSRAPGYVLDVQADAVDSLRFQSLVVAARSAPAARERVELLTRALESWRGEALADFADHEFASAEAVRLGELRLTAQEELFEARLELGEHTALADSLAVVVAQHPLRERLRAVHLRALYRAGRQSEALEAYQELRERLADELGLDPSPALVALQQAMLAQDPSLDSAPSNLPAPLTGLVGRSAAVAAVTGRLTSSRLVTLVGPGGVGKTRLALESARKLTGTHPDGVWLVELGSLTDPAALAEHVSATLGVRDDASGGDHLVEFLRGRRLLLVLDNCEHLTEGVAVLASRLLAQAPGLRVLATSQRPLGLGGEQLWPVAPLEEASAVELFLQRAEAAGLFLDDSALAAVTAVCRRLDGIPLALELAATRVRALGVHTLAERLEDRFKVLTAGHTDAPARQRTLRAMIEWSWSLLTPQEAVLLRRLAVHADGSTLEAAERVSGLDDVLDLLAELVDRSLVTVSGTPPRYRLLESVAAYGVERLREAGEYDELRGRHLEYYAALAASAGPYLRGPSQLEWLGRLDAETGNLRAAFETALGAGGGVELANSLAWYWVLRGRLGEGRRWFTRALEAGTGPSSSGASSAESWRAGFAMRQGEATMPGTSGDPLAAWYLLNARLGVGDLPTAEEHAARILATFGAAGDDWGTAAVLATMARHALLRSDLTLAEQYGKRSHALFTRLGDRWGQLHATFALGGHAEIMGDYPAAARFHREGLRMAEELGLGTEVPDKLAFLGRIALLSGDFAQADELHERARRRSAEQGYTLGEEFAELGLALSARRQGDLDRAERHLLNWLDWDRRLESASALSLILAELGFVAEQRGDAVQARSLHLDGLDAARASGDPRAVALAMEGLAGAASLEGDLAEAARLLETAAGLRASVGAPLPSGERGDVDRITARLKEAGAQSPRSI
ncbi:BTAD domain-containing putative transcriptional regulator [Nonomuraea soli]|uniref:Putative ATPase n=1 Tax=Nonomuraea soli TaxID=1032476 RepID=A0A7W0HV36_9ACTN|nr:BTAD domain-containing putative transcriptional regulator [Nonomuraea soli]MBA2896844.1 putative ATPase [Nonomuraea soli]